MKMFRLCEVNRNGTVRRQLHEDRGASIVIIGPKSIINNLSYKLEELIKLVSITEYVITGLICCT